MDQVSSKLSAYYLSDSEPPKDLEFKDAELYTKEDYFSKSPRLRRVTETKHIDLSPPPREDTNKDLPMILTIGPMLTMGVMALVMLLNTANRLYLGETTIEQSWPSLITSGAMLVSMLVWPLLTKRYNKKQKEKQKKETIEKYNKYLNEKREELTIERKIQKDILIENLKKNEVKITFFIVGEWAEKYPETVKKIYEAGHEIGTHSNTHPHVEQLSAEKNLEEIKLGVEKLQKITGEKTRLYRTPYGEYNDTVINTAIWMFHKKKREKLEN